MVGGLDHLECDEPEGKGEVETSPSPLSQWGQFPTFTGVRPFGCAQGRLFPHRATPVALPT